MRTALVVLTAVLLLTVAAPTVSAGPQCPQVQPWAGVCHFVVRNVETAEQTVEDVQDEIPRKP